MAEFGPRECLDMLGIPFQEKSGRLAFCCPDPMKRGHYDRDPSAGFYTSTGLAYCFSCQYTMPPTLFYARATDQPLRDAERDIEKRYGPQEEKKACNRELVKMVMAKGATALATLKHLPRREHAFLAEALDWVVQSYERLKIDEEALDKALGIWYIRVRESSSEKSDTAGIPEIGTHARLEERLRDILGAGSQGVGQAVAGPLPDDTVDLD